MAIGDTFGASSTLLRNLKVFCPLHHAFEWVVLNNEGWFFHNEGFVQGSSSLSYDADPPPMSQRQSLCQTNICSKQDEYTWHFVNGISI